MTRAEFRRSLKIMLDVANEVLSKKMDVNFDGLFRFPTGKYTKKVDGRWRRDPLVGGAGKVTSIYRGKKECLLEISNIYGESGNAIIHIGRKEIDNFMGFDCDNARGLFEALGQGLSNHPGFEAAMSSALANHYEVSAGERAVEQAIVKTYENGGSW